MKKTALFLNIFLVIGLFLSVGVKAAFAGAHLYFSPSSGTYKVGNNFSVVVKVDNGGQAITSVDGKGTYNSSILELVSIEEASDMIFSSLANGNGFCSFDYDTPGEFEFGCATTVTALTEKLSGSLVKFNFKAKAVGTGKVLFSSCNDGGDTSDSTNVTESVNTTDIIVCSENVSGNYVIKAASSTTSTSTSDTTEDEDSEEETISDETAELPQTGGIGVTLGLVIFGVVSMVSAVLLKFL